MSAAAIDARDVTVCIGAATLLEGVDLRVAAGELVVLIGPNGAGKSTLLAAIAGDRRLTRGRVLLGSADVATLSTLGLANRRACLSQRSHLTAAFTALEVVRLGQPRADDRVARGCLADVDMGGFADRSYPSLSGGEQQRVQLARVLAQLAATPTAALLLDEPLAALDPRHQQLVMTRARRAATAGHAVVVVLHDLTAAARHADRVALLHRGRVVADGPPLDVLEPAILARVFDVRFAIIRGEAGVAFVPM